MKIANLVVEGKNIRKISDILYNHQDDFYRGKPYMYSDRNIIVLMRERYYKRISSYIMSVIFMKFVNDNKVEIEIACSGGREGILMLDYGAQKSEDADIVNQIIEVSSVYLWEITKMEPQDLLVSVKDGITNKIKEKINNPFKK
ncbi:hypothetical protein KPL37_15680 [Clostridium frigoris]|uniref:Uncharacterized protein n=1 Tax=Clostridium frigoris TaxID=205327 RepID=A0ABS6BX27_9CLOT|nr:hypothetical protein [Clostridium frigoris]MBU3161161.1 hypothetical protein [Clostridium frigoris]